MGLMRRLGSLVLATVCVLVCTPQPRAAEPGIFDFHSGFWVNLHQFLYRLPSSATAEPVDPGLRDALAYYRHNIAGRDLLAPEPAAINNRLSAAGSAAELPPAGLDPELATVLAKAAPVYRRMFWPEHNRSNVAWIDAVQPLLSKYGAAIRKELAAAYRVPWPPDPIRTDVCAFAGPVGGYTTVEPAHITISSTDAGYRGTAALEMLFHEASHTLDEGLQQALAAELKAQSKLFRRGGFEHAILFYTAGEIVRRHIPEYEPYGTRNGVLERGWPGSLAVLEKDWKPYLDGRTAFDSAIRAVVADYGVASHL